MWDFRFHKNSTSGCWEIGQKLKCPPTPWSKALWTTLTQVIHNTMRKGCSFFYKCLTFKKRQSFNWTKQKTHWEGVLNKTYEDAEWDQIINSLCDINRTLVSVIPSVNQLISQSISQIFSQSVKKTINHLVHQIIR